MTYPPDDSVTETHKSLEEHVLSNLDQAAASAEIPAKQALEIADTMRWIVIFLAFYTAMVAIACTYAVYKVQQQASKNTQYLVNSCVEGNDGRRSEYQLLFGIIQESYSDNKPLTAKDTARLNAINEKMQETYPQLDCSQVESGKRVIVPYKQVQTTP